MSGACAQSIFCGREFRRWGICKEIPLMTVENDYGRERTPANAG